MLQYEDLRDVILVGHSYGGMVITGVADRSADRIGCLVYLDAATPGNDQSLVDVAGPIIEATRPAGQVVDGVELVLLPGPDAGLMYGVTHPEDLAWMADRLSGHPWKCFEQKLALTNEEALWAIPQYVCTSTLATRRLGSASSDPAVDVQALHDKIANTRHQLWDRLARWVGALDGSAG